MMDSNDPRLTGYVLGELEAADRREVERALETSPDLRLELEAIQQASAMLQASLDAEACPMLTATQRAALDAAAETGPAEHADGVQATVQLTRPTDWRSSSTWRTVALVVAGCLLLAILSGVAVVNLRSRPGALPRNIASAGDDGYASAAATSDDASSQPVPLGLPSDAYPAPAPADPGPQPPGQSVGRGNVTDEPFGVALPELMEEDELLEASTTGPATLSGRKSEERGARLLSASPVDAARPSFSTQPFEISSGAIAIDGADRVENRVEQRQGREQFGLGDEAPDAMRLAYPAAGPVPESAAEFEIPMNEPSDLSTVLEEGRLESARERAVDRRKSLQTLSELSVAQPGKPAAVKTTWRRSRATPNSSQLMIGDHDGLPLEGMQVNVLIDGFRARVLVDLYYYNPHSRRLEGNFKLRLPNEGSLYYFAFGQSAYEYRPQVDQLAAKGFLSGDLLRAASFDPRGILADREGGWSDVKEARIVPREKAAHAYGETVRRRVDPALVEWSGADIFNARVFPLMPRKLHRIVVGYDVNLQHQGDDLTYRLDLPAEPGQCVVDLNVSALPGVTAEVTPASQPFTSGGRAYYNFDDPDERSIEVRLKQAGSIVLTGTDEQAGEFFVTRLTPHLPAGPAAAGSPRVVFLVDTSFSSRPEKFNVWLDLLEAVLTENRDAIEEFAVLFFDVESHWWQDGFRRNTRRNIAQLIADCEKISLEGATDLRQALQQAAHPDWADASGGSGQVRPDVFLLSDGAATWGEMNPHRLGRTLLESQVGPLFAYQTGLTGTAVGTLDHLARETGGAVFSLVDASEISAVARAHRQRPWRLEDVALPGGQDVLVAGRPKFIYPGQALLVVGRGRPDAEATVVLRQGNQRKVVEMAIDRSLESGLAARAYGQVAVGQLEALGDAADDVAVSYARHFRVTGQACSMLMLESEADYRRFNIKPREDAFLVRTSRSADLIAATLDQLAAQQGDARAELTRWLEKLEQVPGLQFEMPPALRLVLERLPAEAFEVEPERLVSDREGRAEMSPKFRQLLESDRLSYADVAGQASRLFHQQGPADALRTLSTLIEKNPGDLVLTRDVAFSAMEWGLGGQAYQLLKRVAEWRPYEPQTYQALSLCLRETGDVDLALIYYEVALSATWHERYRDVKQIVGVEYVDLLRQIERGEVASHARDFAVARLDSLQQRLPVDKADLVVTMMWNTDRTDVDLHVIEPTGEECYFEHRRTKIGGQMTRDVTDGFGPEMYTLPSAKAGEYQLLANYFGSDANRTGVRSRVFVTVYRNYGDPHRQSIEKKTITLSEQKEKRELMTVKIKK